MSKPKLQSVANPVTPKPEKTYEKERAFLVAHGFHNPGFIHVIRDAILYNLSPNHLVFAHRLASRQAAASIAAIEYEHQRQAMLKVA